MQISNNQTNLNFNGAFKIKPSELKAQTEIPALFTQGMQKFTNIEEKGDMFIVVRDNYDKRIEIKNIVNNPSSIIISAPPQFGLTCLSHFMILEAWNNSKLWIYIDSKKIKAHNVIQYVDNELNQLGLTKAIHIDCFIMDEWNPFENGSLKKIDGHLRYDPSLDVMTNASIENHQLMIADCPVSSLNESEDYELQGYCVSCGKCVDVCQNDARNVKTITWDGKVSEDDDQF